MEAEISNNSGKHIIMRVTPIEVSLIAEGLHFVWDSDRGLVTGGSVEIDECDREVLRAEMSVLEEMRRTLDEAWDAGNFSAASDVKTIDGSKDNA